jgi:vancomycin resistance protein YoaR
VSNASIKASGLWGGSDVGKAGKGSSSKQRRSSSKGAGENAPASFFAKIVKIILSILATIGRALAFVGSRLVNLIRSSRVALVVAIAVIAVVAIGVFDTASNWGRAYAGVRVGGVDVAGMTVDEIKSAVSDAYSDRIDNTTVTIFASEDSRSYVNDAIAQAEDRAQAELLSVEQARLNNQLWTTSSHELGGTLDLDSVADAAIAVGREDGGMLSRLGSQFFGHDIDVELTFDSAQLEHLATNIDYTLGDTRIDSYISIANGWAAANSGHDGKMVNRETLSRTVAQKILDTTDDDTFVATVEDAPSRISYDQASELASSINRIISDGAVFEYSGSEWTADATTLGSWISTTVEQDGSSWKITPYIQSDVAKPQIMKGILESAKVDPIAVSFSKSSDGSIIVSPSSDEQAPAVGKAATDLNDALFGANGKLVAGSLSSQVAISVGMEDIPSTMTLEESVSSGIVTVVGTYTTEYSTYSGTENRNHNIHLAADLINNSIVKANGGEWDFNDVAGDCNEERGFQSAGTIIDGEYVDNIGGGICQVATTVFNAVYDSGLDIIERHNHSLYLSSYPDGRDAAVSYPDLTLVWGDETDSDVLLTTSYTESDLTVTLYSAPVDYTVSTETGDWVEGEEYQTIEKTDESLGAGQSYVYQNGKDGRSITVTRYVKDSSGTVIKTNIFASNYDPVDEVILKGPDGETS